MFQQGIGNVLETEFRRFYEILFKQSMIEVFFQLNKLHVNSK